MLPTKYRLEEGWTSLFLLGALMITVSRALAVAGWTEGLDPTWAVGVLGVLSGLALAKSRFTGRGSIPFVVGYGLFLIGWLNGRDLSYGLWLNRIWDLSARTWNFFYKALHGGTNRDALVFVLFVQALIWLMGVFAAWSVFRRKEVWPAVIPPGVALFVNVYYYFGPENLQWYLPVYLLIVLLLVARIHLYRRETEWREASVAFSPELHLDVLRASLIAALAVLSLAWMTPSAQASADVATAWSRVTGPWNDVREGWNRLFSSLRSYGQITVFDYYGDSLVLSGPVRNSDRPIMDVQAVQLPTGRYYWRSRVFDRYEDGRWESTETETITVDPEQEALNFTPYRGRRVVDLRFISFVPASSVLYVAQQPLSLDRPVEYEFNLTQNGTADVTVVRSQNVLRQGESYNEAAFITDVDAGSLRQSGDNYPLWVTERYLQVPPEITDRTRRLAAELTAGAPTAYDKAFAITVWLRENILYNDQREAPPPGVEPVDHLLFELKEGYCYYYSSAMVMMLRSLGIPSRVAVGFAQGEYLLEQGIFRVRERDAHAWPEVYFPGYGWVEFEPTASQLPLVRPAASAAALEDEQVDPEGLPAGAGGVREDLLLLEERDSLAAGGAPGSGRLSLGQRVGLGAGVIFLALLALGGAWWVLEYGGLSANPGKTVLGAAARRLQRAGVRLPPVLARFAVAGVAGLTAARLAYARLVRALRWLGLGSRASSTPFERAAALERALPEGRAPAFAIAEEYVRETYGNQPGDEAITQAAWSALRLGVWMKAVRRRVGGA